MKKLIFCILLAIGMYDVCVASIGKKIENVLSSTDVNLDDSSDPKISFSPCKICIARNSKFFESPTFSNATDSEVKFFSDNENVAKVSKNGTISLAGGVGTATITATVEATSTYYADTAECVIIVYDLNTYVKAKSIESGKRYLMVICDDDNMYYVRPSSNSYGYLYAYQEDCVSDTIIYPSSVDYSYLITEAGDSCTILENANNLYLVQKSNYASFNFQSSPKSGQYWAIAPQENGQCIIKNTSTNKVIQYSTTYESVGAYSSMRSDGILPYLYMLKNEKDSCIAEGRCGTCIWKIGEDSVLTISPEDGMSGKLDNWATYYDIPWFSYRQLIKGAIVEAGVSAQNCYDFFYGMKKCEFVDISNLKTDGVKNFAYMFYNCESLTNIDLSHLNTDSAIDMSYMFYNCSQVNALAPNALNTSNNTNFSCMFYGCKSLTSLDLSNFKTSSATNFSEMFKWCSSLEVLNVSGFDTSKGEDFTGMFAECSSLRSLNLDSFDTSKSTEFNAMFYNCSSLRELNINNFVTSNAKSFQFMFSGCSSLECLDVSNFNTENATQMYEMFAQCSSLKELNVSNFNTSNVMAFNSMFKNCSSLKNLYVSGFNTSKAKGWGFVEMFSGCSSLDSLDVSNFNTTNASYFYGMFQNCVSLKYLNLGGENWIIDCANNDAIHDFLSGDTSIVMLTTPKNVVDGLEISLPQLMCSKSDTTEIYNSLPGNHLVLVSKTNVTLDVSNIHFPEFENNTWFTIDGKKLLRKPIERGTYIHNHKKTIID